MPASSNRKQAPKAISRKQAQGDFGDNDDFIAFGPDDKGEKRRDAENEKPNDKDKEKAKSSRASGSKGNDPKSQQSVREWDKGKKRERSPERSRGKKRKHDSMAANEPRSKKQRSNVNEIPQKAPWSSDVDWDSCTNVAEMFHREVDAFIHWVSPTPEEDEVRSLVVEHISQAIKSSFPDAHVMPFGSYETKLYLPSGDIDLVVISQSMAYSNKNNVLHAIAQAMVRHGITSSKVTVIANARVPIVKFTTSHGRFKVDISINQESGIKSGQIINSFMNEMQGCQLALRSLVMIVKAFLSQRSLNEVFTGGLGSYSIVCMAISFLQMHPKIRRGEIDASKNLGVLVAEFFELYGRTHNFEHVGLSLRDGGTYFSKAHRWGISDRPLLLSIEDPADPSNDISKGSYGYPKVRLSFAGAHDMLMATLYYRAGVLAAKRDGHHIRFSDHNPSDMSILSSIMFITQETLNHRKLIKELHQSRTLHRLTGIKPKVTTVNAPEEARPEKTEEHPWEESEMELESDDSYIALDSQRRSQIQPEEEGRYDIGARTSKRQNRTATYTEFSSEDDEDGWSGLER